MSGRIEQIGMSVLYCGDCREIAAEIAADAMISDPPYGIGYVRRQKMKTDLYKGANAVARSNKFAGVRIAGDDRSFDPTPWLRYGNVLLWGADHYRAALPVSGRFLAWDKLAGLRSWDDFSDVEFAWHSKTGPSRIFSYLWKGLCCDKREGRGAIERDHPMQKPVDLMMWCIRQAGMPRRVFDPFMGSGTTGVAALRLGCHFVGIEIEERWFDVACRRIEAEARQLRLELDCAC